MFTLIRKSKSTHLKIESVFGYYTYIENEHQRGAPIRPKESMLKSSKVILLGDVNTSLHFCNILIAKGGNSAAK